MTSFDLTHHKVIAAEDIEAAARAGATELLVREGAILTPSARDAVADRRFSLKAAGVPVNGSNPHPTAPTSPPTYPRCEMIPHPRSNWICRSNATSRTARRTARSLTFGSNCLFGFR